MRRRYYHSSFLPGTRGRVRRRGFVHVLLLVFAVLGITMWGMSELFQRHLEQKNTIERESNTALESARDALFDYALTSPAKVEARALPGLYNAYEHTGTITGVSLTFFNDASLVAFRRFSLPCPDVAEGDGYLDGVSDILTAGCFGGNTSPLASGSRFGRLPWRDLNDQVGGTYTYIRGVGDRDYRDGYGERFWYALSDNVTDTSLPMNPHSLIRMTSGWLTATDGAGEELSDRVAAVVIAPGGAGPDNTDNRINEERLYGGEGTTPILVAAATYPTFHESYLEGDTYTDLITGTESFIVRNLSGEPFADQIEYLTIDELASDSGRGVEVLENGEESVYDMLAGDENFLGVPEMLSEHLQRFGYLPDPAVFDESAVTLRHRPSGIPAQSGIEVTANLEIEEEVVTPSASVTTTMTVTTTIALSGILDVQQGAIVSVAGTATVMAAVSLRVADLPPVYLLPGTEISLTRDQLYAPALPPYNIPLADLDTQLNEIPLDAAVSMEHATAGHYPTEGLFGLQGGLFSVNVSNVLSVSFLSPTFPIFVGVSGDLPVVLAAPAYAYFQSGNLVDLIAYTGGDRTGIENLPPYSAKVLLPAGTRLTLADFGSLGVELKLPARYAVNNAVYDPVLNVWSFQGSSDQAVEIVINDAVAAADKLVGVNNVPDHWPVVAGDSGFLPVEENLVQVYPASGRAQISLTDEENAISDLSIDMRLYTEATLTIIPFPPPGRPASQVGDITPLPSPVLILPNSEFDLPVGGRVIYPNGSDFIVGDGFRFPDDSVVRFPDGAVLDVVLSPDGVLSDGYQPGNTVALENFRVTLLNGGFVSLRDTRPVIGDAAVFGAQQKVFDIELRGNAQFRDSGGSSFALNAGQIFQPFTGRSFARDSVISLGDGDVLSSNSRVRAGFLTYPRLFYQHAAPNIVPRNTEIKSVSEPVILSGLQGIAAPDIIEDLTDVTLSMFFDEDTEFFLPPGFALSLTYSDVTLFWGGASGAAGDVERLVQSVRLPVRTGLFDPDYAATLAALTLSGGRTPAAIQLGESLSLTLIVPFEVARETQGATPSAFDPARQGIARRRLALFPDNDMYVFRAGGGVELIPAGSIIDIVDHEAYLPTGVQRVQRVAEDLQIVSDGAMEIFFARDVTMRLDRQRFETRQRPNGTYQYYPSLSIIGLTLHPTIVINYAAYDSLTSGIATERHLTVVSEPIDRLGRRSRIYAPAGTFVRVPPGSPLDFIADDLNRYVARAAGRSPLAVDYAVLPERAVMVIPPGGTLTVYALTVSLTMSLTVSAGTTLTTTMTTTMSVAVDIPGPAHIQAQQGETGIALVNDTVSGDPYHIDPLIFLSSPARLVDSIAEDNIAESFYSEIPANARLDIKGRMEIRGDSGFHAGMLPSETATFLRDFPMLYAVAPECRQAVSPGRECAEGPGEGLTFELEQGEEYILTESLEAPGGVLLKANVPGLDLVVEAMSVNAAAHMTVDTAAVIIDETTGMVTIDGSAFQPEAHEVLLVRLDDHTHPRAELRAYFGAFSSFGDDVSDAPYAAVDGEFTVHVGGYVGGGYDTAEAKAALNPGTDIVFGAGAQLRGGVNGDKIFGINSRAILDLNGYLTEVGLDDYVILNADKFYASLTLSADSAEVDVFGDVYDVAVDRAANDVFDAFGADFRAGSIDEQRTARGAIEVADDAAIEIEPGYVWQGYIPPGAELEFTENTDIAGRYTLSSDTGFRALNAIMVTTTVGSWPNREVHIRMQSTVEALNVWGAGIERPEATDKFGSYGVYDLGGGSRVNAPPVTLVNTFEYEDLTYSVSASITVATMTVTLIGNSNLSEHNAGFLSPATNPSLIVDVREMDGSFVERATAVWNPITRVEMYDTLGRILVPSSPTATVAVTAMIWNRKSNPFPGPVDFAYAMTLATSPNVEELWAGRLVDSGLAEEDSHIAINTGTFAGATAAFNMPHFQIWGRFHQTWDVVGAYQVAYDWGNQVSLGALTQGPAGTSITLRAAERPLYQPIDGTEAFARGYDVGSPATTLSNPNIETAPVTVTVNSDLTFYLDHTYDILPRQFVRFGDDFNIVGPAALVPPFGGLHEQAVKDVYAERSNLMQAVVPNAPALHEVYDIMEGNCVGTNDCAAMFNNSSWLPILLGEVAFEGVKVSLQNSIRDSLSDELRLVMPQPGAMVENSSGARVPIYAGSIIYPRLKTIIPSTPLPPGEYELILPDGPALAAVDVSPVNPLRPRAFYRSRDGFLPRGAFNLPPVTATVVTPSTVTMTYLLDPVGFTQEDVVDLSQWVTVQNSSLTMQAIYGGGSGRDILAVEDYDGTFVRGILLDEDGTQLITSYYSGANPFALTGFFAEANRHDALPPRNTDMELGDPLSFRWVYADEHFVALGAERTGADDLARCNAALFTPPCAGVSPLGVSGLYFFDESGVTVQTDGNEFTPLRLAHRITIPRGARMNVHGYNDKVPYPSQADNFFRFPAGSEAVILNADAASWVSAHPYIARYQQGLVVTLSASAGNVQVLTVGSGDNDGVRSMDVSGMRVLHYHKSERNEGLPPLSSVPVYTNVWLRLPFGGVLVNRDTGEATRLQRNALFNPLLGTYLTDRFDIAVSKLENNYLTEGTASRNISVAITLVRPALTIPAGARVVAGAAGGKIENVKAAAIFSLAPLDAVECPTGDFNILNGQYQEGLTPSQQISQIREGVSENRYTAATIGLSHPCIWIDDPENIDGDRIYLYRGRRRYLDESLQARTISNDRTYLLGGKVDLYI